VLDRDWQAEIGLLRRRERKARAILGVLDTTDRGGIRRAFRRATLVNHPDLNPGDEETARRFHLIRCAYKCLTEGESCAALDELEPAPEAPGDTKYRLDNPWGYWCWWREKYFSQSGYGPGEQENSRTGEETARTQPG